MIRDYKQLQSYREELGKSSLPKTLEKYQKIIYNKSDKENLDHYIFVRRTGSLSAVSSFSDWQNMFTKLKTIFVGQTAANGKTIISISRHFVDRVIGSIYQDRSGVSIKNLQHVVMNGKIANIVIDKKGRKSQRIYIDDFCDITINPDSGELIQCNPNSK